MDTQVATFFVMGVFPSKVNISYRSEKVKQLIKNEQNRRDEKPRKGHPGGATPESAQLPSGSTTARPRVVSKCALAGKL